MDFIPNILFAIALIIGVGYFAKNVKKLSRNIKLGQDVSITDNKGQRCRTMALIALVQTKTIRRSIAGILHFIVYIGFTILNSEMLEIISDGLFRTHRIFSTCGKPYGILNGTFE